MSDRVLVVGSGASGVHFALTLLRRGRKVTMLDVGRHGRAPVLPQASLTELKARLPDPVEYLLGAGFEAVHLPGVKEEYYGIPPSKSFVFDPPGRSVGASAGFAPLFSFAQGGLAEAWTGGCYPLNAGELADFPFPEEEIRPHYAEVARRIGISGTADDLARFMPVHDHLQPPLRLDDHSRRLLEKYVGAREHLNASGVYMGHSRVATLSQPLAGRQPCDYLGRCLWGCPHGALYTPSQTLRDCMSYPDFQYVADLEVRSVRLGSGGRVAGVVARSIDTGLEQEFAAGTVALAAGALTSTRIFLESVRRHSGGAVRLGGLMDNRQVLVPFVNLRMIGREFSATSYQYHLLGMGLESSTPKDYVHGQITTLKTALVHPLIQRVPLLDIRAATRLFRSVHAALGLVNVNFPAARTEASFVELDGDDDRRLRIHYASPDGEDAVIATAVGRVKRALSRLGCVVPPGMVQVRPMGASVHYAGTLPMSREARPWTVTPECESREIGNLFMVDGATFPFLPAKNITFTLMANAVRVAEAMG